MEHMVAVLTVTLILLSASIYDWRYREIPDWHWWVLFILAMMRFFFFTMRMDVDFIGYLFPVCIGLIAFECLYERKDSVLYDLALYAAIAVTAIIPFMVVGGELGNAFITIPIIYAVMKVLYHLDIVKGGADAKAIISIATVFPTYPQIFGMPLIPVPEGLASLVFPPAFAILVMALAITLVYGLVNAIRNIALGNRLFPQMLFGTVMPLEKAKRSQVWPMERVTDDGVKVVLSANEDENAWNELESAGRTDVWVTAIIPFIIPMAIAYILMLTVGFPLFALMG